jgi:F0F1-type ATP synthase assembly protein I
MSTMRAPKPPGGASGLRWMSLFQVGTVLVTSIALGYFLGAWLDRKWGSSPWAVVGGVVLGSVVGFIDLFRTVSRNLK